MMTTRVQRGGAIATQLSQEIGEEEDEDHDDREFIGGGAAS
jgi:hypothetical protein